MAELGGHGRYEDIAGAWWQPLLFSACADRG
jgi:hypothetical protein